VSVATFHTWADIEVETSGSFRWINSVHTYVGLTGITIGLNLRDTYSYAYNQTTTTVNWQGGGVVDQYIWVPGLGDVVVGSTAVSCGGFYNVY